MKKIVIINGPNLNLLGKREPEIYGTTSFDDFFAFLKEQFPHCELIYKQSNVEGEIINFIQQFGFEADIVLNAGGYTHTSVAIADAVAAVTKRVIEVHISNIKAREEIRHTSLISQYCNGSIIGLGLEGYRLAIEYLLKNIQ